jgi:hypothetical protein
MNRFLRNIIVEVFVTIRTVGCSLLSFFYFIAMIGFDRRTIGLGKTRRTKWQELVTLE